MGNSIIRFENITKQFPGVTALSEVSFSVEKGEIHSLCGENGAGKSTLINLCGGVFQPNGGKIIFEGNEVRITSEKQSEDLGISIVFQEVPVCLNMSISDNIFLGPNPKTKKKFFLDQKYMAEETKRLLSLFELDLDPKTETSKLSIAEQSIVQIAKCIYANPKLLIMDEPTSALSGDQKDRIFKIIRQLCKEQGTTVLFISHRLDELLEIGDRVSVLKDGCYVGTKETAGLTTDDIVSMMVGRDIEKIRTSQSRVTDEELLRVEGFTADRFNDVSFRLNKGEILGFAGFVGAGRTELMRAIYGLDKFHSGTVYLEGKQVKLNSAESAIEAGIGMVPENRKDDAIIPLMTVAENMFILFLKKLVRKGLINQKLAKSNVDELVQRLFIKVTDTDNSIMSLSGGNQQKVVMARWIWKSPNVLICDEPTRGIDVAAKREMHDIMVQLAETGMGIIMVSSELPEILSISDRIIVMHEGKVTGELMKDEATEEEIMRLAAATVKS
jgi:ABC-type sugar transport system ATPase subunit